MVSIDLDGIDEAISRGVDELKKSLTEASWPDVIAIGRRGGKSTIMSGMMEKAFKGELPAAEETEIIIKKSRYGKGKDLAELDWDLETRKTYFRPSWAGKFRDSKYDGFHEFLIPDTIMSKPVESVSIDTSPMHSPSLTKMKLICDGIEVECVVDRSGEIPFLRLTGFSEYRDLPPAHRLLGDSW